MRLAARRAAVQVEAAAVRLLVVQAVQRVQVVRLLGDAGAAVQQLQLIVKVALVALGQFLFLIAHSQFGLLVVRMGAAVQQKTGALTGCTIRQVHLVAVAQEIVLLLLLKLLLLQQMQAVLRRTEIETVQLAAQMAVHQAVRVHRVQQVLEVAVQVTIEIAEGTA